RLYNWRPFLRKNGGLTLLKRRPYAGLETNTSLSHIGASRFGCCEPRVRIPVKRFLARPFPLKPAPRSRRCLEKPTAAFCAAVALTRKQKAIFIDLLSWLRP